MGGGGGGQLGAERTWGLDVRAGATGKGWLGRKTRTTWWDAEAQCWRLSIVIGESVCITLLFPHFFKKQRLGVEVSVGTPPPIRLVSYCFHQHSFMYKYRQTSTALEMEGRGAVQYWDWANYGMLSSGMIFGKSSHTNYSCSRTYSTAPSSHRGCAPPK